MKSILFKASIALAALAALGQAGANTNRAVIGSPVQEVRAGTRIVDVATAKSINVNCGDIVTFRNEGRTFSWKFDVNNHGVVNLSDIAPAGFAQRAIRIYVGANESERPSGA